MAYHVFISYRRQGASELALLLYKQLSDDGYSPFLDVKGMNSGHFDNQLYDHIAECSDMLVLLPPDAFAHGKGAEDWFYNEISYALRAGKNVIPVMLPGFQWPQTMLPFMDELRYCQGVEVSTQYFDAMYAKIRDLISYKPSSSPKTAVSFPRGLLAALVICVVLAAGAAGMLLGASGRDKTPPSATATPTPSMTATPRPTATPTPKPTSTPKPTAMTSNGLVFELSNDGSCWYVIDYIPRNSDATRVEIPAKVEGIEVERIDCKAFLGQDIEEVVLPDTVTHIYDEAFYGCFSLRHITLSNKLIGISDYAFGGCSNLSRITIPASVEGIAANAFDYIDSSKPLKTIFNVERGSYAESYAQRYGRSYEYISVYSAENSSHLTEADKYSRYGKPEGFSIYWLDRADLNDGKTQWEADFEAYQTVSKTKFEDMLKNHMLFFRPKIKFTKTAPKQSVRLQMALQTPSGKVACVESIQDIPALNPGGYSKWLLSLSPLIWTLYGQDVPEESGTYTVYFLIDGQQLGAKQFTLTN